MSMRTLVIVLLGVSLAFSGCRKKSARQFYDLESTYSIMVARDGDDAYSDEVMDQVVTGLQAIPADAIEGPKAAALLAQIHAERARLAAEKAALEAAVAGSAKAAPSLPSLIAPDKDRGAQDADAGRADAGPDLPWAEMPVSEFNKRFGSCMEPPGELEIPGLGKAMTFRVKQDAACTKRLKVPADTRLIYLFKDSVLRGERTERQTMPDAGAAAGAAQQAAPSADAGPTMPWIPGMPYPQ